MRRAILVTCAVGATALGGCGGGSMHSEHLAAGAPDARAAATPGVPGQGVPSFARDTARLRIATAAFRSMDSATAAGYPSTPMPGCISHPTLGGMGYHLTNEKLLDDRIEVERPEILVYQRTPSGEYALTGVEYMVPFSAHPREKPAPTVMGQELKPFDRGKFWYRHVWIWLANPAGLFEDWNPKVTCS